MGSVALYSLIMAFGATGLYLLLARSSLEYHARIYNVSPKVAKSFLDGLRPPLDYFFVRPHFNLLTSKSGKTPVEHLTTLQGSRSQVSRIALSIFALAIILLVTIRLFSLSEIKWILIYAIFLIVNIVGLYSSWRFGHKFKDMSPN